MKVVCDACQAKYQIPDERVEGRKLKIRCRKCGGTIVVRGDGADANPRASLPPATPEWHVSLQGEQHGPYPTRQMASMLREGVLAWDAHVWRDGYAEWKSAGESDTLVRAVAAAGEDEPTFAAKAPSEPSEDAATFTAPQPVAPGAGPYSGDETPTRIAMSSSSDDLQPAARISFAQRSAQRAHSSPNLRAASQPPMLTDSRPPQLRYSTPPGQLAAQRPVSTPPYAYAASAALGYDDPRVDAAAALTGERHEDSVLFSAQRLAPLAAETPVRAGYASAEGSGLIDIRALAQLAQTQKSTGSAPPVPIARTNGKSARAQDDVLRMANQTGGFTRLDSLAPFDRPSVAPSRAVPIAIVSGCAMIAMAGVAIVYLIKVQPQQQAVSVSAPVAVPEVTAPLPAAEPPSAAPQPEPPQPTRPALAAAAVREPEADMEPEAPAAQKTRGSPRPTKAIAAAVAAPRSRPAPLAKGAKTAPEPEVASVDKGKAKKEASPSIDDMLLDNPKKAAAPAPVASKAEPKTEPEGPDPLAGIEAAAKSKEKPKSRSIDELLDDAVPGNGGGGKKSAAEAASAALPDTPSRDQVLSAMRDVQGAVQACAEGQDLEAPTATVAMTITGSSGKVTSAQVNGIGGTVGSCIARAVRGASFPKFAKAQFSINYPFKLKK